MPSRMERYYQSEVDISKRTKKNERLYNNIHNSLDYDDVKQISNVNEISPEKLNEILNNDKKVQRSEIKTVTNDKVLKSRTFENVEDNRNYDIREVLQKAKTDKTENGFDYHKIKEEQINLLKKIESYKASKQEQDESLNELLNTIASTKLLQELNDRDLSLDLLGDLKSNNANTIVGGIDSINKVINDIPKVKAEINEKNEIDNSFYTSSMKFDAEDFDELKEIKTKLNKNNSLMKLIIIVLSIIVIVVIVLLVVNFL